VVEPPGLVTLTRAAAEPSEMNAAAEVYCVPGRRMSWDVAPAERMAVTAAWTVVAQVVIVTENM
jgi:hypothetical protein